MANPPQITAPKLARSPSRLPLIAAALAVLGASVVAYLQYQDREKAMALVTTLRAAGKERE